MWFSKLMMRFMSYEVYVLYFHLFSVVPKKVELLNVTKVM